MVDYYKILGVKHTATAAEIKSAYRRLAQKRHPDHNGGSEHAAREFALLALAYRTLSDPQERAQFDAKRNRPRTSASFIHSNNPHAHRLRMVTVQARMDRAVDRWLEDQRRDTLALQQAVFPTVALFLSTFFAAVLKPRFWHGFGFMGRAIMFALFLVGVWHLALRLRTCFERYTYRPKVIHDSLFAQESKPEKPFTRFTAFAFLFTGAFASLVLGLFVGEYMHYVILDNLPFLFDHQARADLLFYPPIAVLIVDTMHTVANKIDL